MSAHDPALAALRKIADELQKIVAARGQVKPVLRDWLLKTARDGIARAEEEKRP